MGDMVGWPICRMDTIVLFRPFVFYQIYCEDSLGAMQLVVQGRLEASSLVKSVIQRHGSPNGRFSDHSIEMLNTIGRGRWQFRHQGVLE